MRIHRTACRLATAILLMGALTDPTLAQDRVEVISGRVYEGEILSDDGETVEIETTSGTTLKLPYQHLTMASRYRLMRKRTPDDVDAQMDLADWCVEQVLYEEARRHFDAALAKDPARSDEVNARLDAARTKAGADSLSRAKALMAEGRDRDARELLGKILQQLPQEPVAKEAAALLEEEATEQKEELLGLDVLEANKGVDGRAGKRAKRADGKEYSNRARQLMRPTVERYYNIIDWTTAAQVTNSQVNAIELLIGAIAEEPKMLQEADAMSARAETDPEIAEAIQLARLKAEEAVVEACVNLAQIYLLKHEYERAQEVVDGRIADYPDNVRLAHLKARINSAIASGQGAVILGRGRDP
jgi:thioredoxin-like negative regulator of GroEL